MLTIHKTVGSLTDACHDATAVSLTLHQGLAVWLVHPRGHRMVSGRVYMDGLYYFMYACTPVTGASACWAEMMGTFLLMFVVAEVGLNRSSVAKPGSE